MSVFAKTLIEKFPDKTIGYLLFDEIVPELVNLSSSYSQAQKNEFIEDINLYSHLDILLIDNFGDEEKNDFAKENIILKILKTRLELNLPTFIISSHQKQELYTLYNTPRNGRYLVKEILDILNTYQEINLPTFINLNDK
jgi:DNA replication protein DnaC